MKERKTTNMIGQHPAVKYARVLAIRRSFAAQWAFVLARFSPRAYLGLHLTIGVVLLVGASWMFGGIAEDVMNGDPLTITDKHVADWLHHRATPEVTAAMQVITTFGSFVWVTSVAVVAGLVLWWKRSWYRLLALVLVVPGGAVLLSLLKLAFHRHRPTFDDAFLLFQGYSFPSGHTMAATDLYGLLAVFAVLAFEAWRHRTLAILWASVMALLVGFSRLYLGAHYLSDVLGGVAAGLAWLAVSLTAVDTVRRKRGHLL